MAETKTYLARFKTLKEALGGFEEALAKDYSSLDTITLDLVKNGQAQKFEYCTELMWKTLKHYLQEMHGIEEKSPKTVIKAFYRVSKIEPSVYEALIRAIDERNLFSHVYDEAKFNELLSHLKSHAHTMSQVTQWLTNN